MSAVGAASLRFLDVLSKDAGFWRKNLMLIGLVLAVVLAWLTPNWGASGGYLASEVWTKAGVVLIFLLQGFGLSTSVLLRGASKWRLHLLTQAWISFGVPVIVGLTVFASGSRLPTDLAMALFFLSVLPTTVSSAVAFIVQVDGNVSGGVFNTVMSNLLAVLIVPLAVIGFAPFAGEVQMPGLGDSLQAIMLMVVGPLLIGQLLRRLFPAALDSVMRHAKPLNQGVILFMVYSSLATSFRDGVWTDAGGGFVFAGAFLAATLLLVVTGLVWISARRLLQDPADRATALFCGSQKSLAVGVPYAATIFEGSVVMPVS